MYISIPSHCSQLIPGNHQVCLHGQCIFCFYLHRKLCSSNKQLAFICGEGSYLVLELSGSCSTTDYGSVLCNLTTSLAYNLSRRIICTDPSSGDSNETERLPSFVLKDLMSVHVHVHVKSRDKCPEFIRGHTCMVFQIFPSVYVHVHLYICVGLLLYWHIMHAILLGLLLAA